MSRLCVTFVASIVVAALAASGAGAHDGVETAAGHAAEDAVTHTAAQERALGRTHARRHGVAARRGRGGRRCGARRTWASGVRSSTGRSSACTSRCCPTARCSPTTRSATTRPRPIPCRTTRARPCGIRRPASQTPVNVDTGFNVFCSGLAHLVDGRLFLAGGNKDHSSTASSRRTSSTRRTNTWSLGPNMAAGRWYPTVTPLRNGEMLITSGRVEHARGADARRRPAHAEHRVAEPAAVSVDGRRAGRPGVLLRPRPDAARARHDRHRRVADARAARLDQPRLRRPRDLRRRQDARRGRRSLDEGRAGRRLQRGDAAGLADGADGLRAPAAQPHRARRRHGPRDRRQLLRRRTRRPQRRRLPAEQWNPATGQWRTLAAMQITRQYHSTALLLPDGRVLSSGGGICGTCDQVGYLGKNAEVFSPPYLFQADGTLAPRPAIDVGAGRRRPTARQFEIATGDSGVDPQGRARPARRRHALGQHGAALHPAVLHHGRDEPDRDRAGQRQRRAAGHLHAVPRRRQRRAVGGAHGEREAATRRRPSRSRSRRTARPSRRPRR